MIIRLIPKTHSAFKSVEEFGELYVVTKETPLHYELESVNYKKSDKGLKVYHYRKIQKFSNDSFIIAKEGEDAFNS